MKKSPPTGKRKIKGVLFDFDGTLTCPGALDFPAIKRAIRCPEDKPILEFLDALPPEKRAPLEKILEERETAAARVSLPNAGAESCISALKREGFFLGILTRNSLRSVRVAFQRFHGIGPGDFDVIITRENSLPKPHPDGIYQAARKMGLSPEEILVVGDFRFDVICGHEAGASTVLLAPDNVSVMHAGDPEPDHVIRRLEELLDILGIK
ncbi:MAG: HAD family hydrolase [Deltaproteobacteria bacterium]|nr:HAD family hydrolase [Deltaproteobacteria bacterium]MBW2017537.1 HAD family hydrolase [Deltaproteobacteria bacterium]MBW2128049.1 HAD family hydrolase [Deltaproteobacteria bacterium]MBW2304069.1 HAD family hydrolase [Deltaproteobacteria bacterium]